tara:strand:- start:175 stop:417 length:243 start_codon:yes stop_codon:yes gene_type:complete
MEYYLLLPSDSEQDTLNEANLLGTESFGSFWPGSGLVVLMTLVQDAPEALLSVKIKTDTGVEFGVSEFLEVLDKLNIRRG